MSEKERMITVDKLTLAFYSEEPPETPDEEALYKQVSLSRSGMTLGDWKRTYGTVDARPAPKVHPASPTGEEAKPHAKP